MKAGRIGSDTAETGTVKQLNSVNSTDEPLMIMPVGSHLARLRQVA